MKVLAVGADAVGFIAIGQQATGVFAFGQLATGVVAVGQLARGVVAIGQLSVGVVALGQLAVGLGWAAGMLAFGSLGPAWMLGIHPIGELCLRSLRRGRLGDVRWKVRWNGVLAVRLLAVAVLAAIVVTVSLVPLYDDLTRAGGILREPPRPLR